MALCLHGQLVRASAQTRAVTVRQPRRCSRSGRVDFLPVSNLLLNAAGRGGARDLRRATVKRPNSFVNGGVKFVLSGSRCSVVSVRIFDWHHQSIHHCSSVPSRLRAFAPFAPCAPCAPCASLPTALPVRRCQTRQTCQTRHGMLAMSARTQGSRGDAKNAKHYVPDRERSEHDQRSVVWTPRAGARNACDRQPILEAWWREWPHDCRHRCPPKPR